MTEYSIGIPLDISYLVECCGIEEGYSTEINYRKRNNKEEVKPNKIALSHAISNIMNH
jgi:hypothetical protein